MGFKFLPKWRKLASSDSQAGHEPRRAAGFSDVVSHFIIFFWGFFKKKNFVEDIVSFVRVPNPTRSDEKWPRFGRLKIKASAGCANCVDLATRSRNQNGPLLIQTRETGGFC